MPRNRSPQTLMLGMSGGVAAVEETRVVPRQVKPRITTWRSSSAQYIYPKELKARTRTDTCTPVLTAVSFTIAKRWKELT